MNIIFLKNEYQMLKCDIDRMFITDNMNELHIEFCAAVQRLSLIYKENCERINENKDNFELDMKF